MAAVFLVVGVVGLVVLLLSLFAGELGDLSLGDLDVDGWFSVPAIAALLALAVGLVVAVPLAWGAVRLSRALTDMPTQETLTRHHLVGAQGVVVSPVPGAGFGEVRLTLAGQQIKFSARSHVPLAAGTPVYVVEALSETSVEVVSTAPESLPHPLPEPGGNHP